MSVWAVIAFVWVGVGVACVVAERTLRDASQNSLGESVAMAVILLIMAPVVVAYCLGVVLSDLWRRWWPAGAKKLGPQTSTAASVAVGPPLASTRSRLSVEDFKAEFAVALSRSTELTAFLAKWEDGDELWRHSSPPEAWRALMGREHVVLVRDGQPIASILTCMN